MIQNEEMFDLSVSSPSYSDNSSLSGCGFEDMEDLELFPDLKEIVSRQQSSESDVVKEDGAKGKRNVVAVRLDPGKERELIDYLLGKSEENETKTNGEVLKAIQQKVNGESNKFEYGSKLYSYNDQRDFAGKCMSKNAVAARENRLRKKQYIGDLEQSVKSLSSENTNLKNQVSSMKQTVTDLKTEVKYLRSVLANQSTLSALLKNIPSVAGINLTTSVTTGQQPVKAKGRKRAMEADSDEENIDSNIQVDNTEYELVEVVEEEPVIDNCGVIQGSGVRTRGQLSKVPKLDHSYATNNPSVTQFQKRNQHKTQQLDSRSKTQDDNSGSGSGVCLHVSGAKVSLEFCSQCSRRASADERQGS